jgi:hypothetical protein
VLWSEVKSYVSHVSYRYSTERLKIYPFNGTSSCVVENFSVDNGDSLGVLVLNLNEETRRGSDIVRVFDYRDFKFGLGVWPGVESTLVNDFYYAGRFVDAHV